MKNLLKAIQKYSEKKLNRWVRMAFFASIFLMENKWFGQTYFTKLTNGYGMIDMNMFNSAKSIMTYLGAIGDSGRSAYLVLLGLDFILIATFFLLQTTLTQKLVDGLNASSYMSILILFPIGRAFMDALENITMIINTCLYPTSIPVLLSFSAATTFVKWICLWGTVAILLILIILNIRKILIRKFSLFY